MGTSRTKSLWGKTAETWSDVQWWGRQGASGQGTMDTRRARSKVLTRILWKAGRQVSHRDQWANRKLGWAGERVWNKGVHWEWTDIWEGSLSEETTSERGESTDREPEIKALDGSAKTSDTSDKYQDLVGTMFMIGKNRTDIKTNYMKRRGLA